jgi:hypothetical protein
VYRAIAEKAVAKVADNPYRRSGSIERAMIALPAPTAIPAAAPARIRNGHRPGGGTSKAERLATRTTPTLASRIRLHRTLSISGGGRHRAEGCREHFPGHVSACMSLVQAQTPGLRRRRVAADQAWRDHRHGDADPAAGHRTRQQPSGRLDDVRDRSLLLH